ncbi:MAG: Magnesium and cobalt transport protein CorA [uncultured bacterium]|nr:MAG: Magnesium and cobalt transport protein CorA [uncultured bacterium]HBH18826.1 magnesium and cobalt transport protein CorA [Cyanobacteria bacterium UBA9579]
MLEIIYYNDTTKKVKSAELDEIQGLLQDEKNTVWIDFEYPAGVWPDEKETYLLEKVLNIHPLNIEDCVHEEIQPKIEEYKDYLFLIINKLNFSADNKLKIQDINLFLGKNFIVTYKTEKIDAVDSIKCAFKSEATHILGKPVLLFHSITDHIIDSYLSIIDKYDINIDQLEAKTFKTHDYTNIIQRLSLFREDLNNIRRPLVTQKEIFYNLARGYYELIRTEDQILFRDIYDHLDKDVGMVDNLRDSIAGIFDIQFSLSSQKLNEIIKFLTLISTIFIPATLISGIFGMNFMKFTLFETSYGFAVALGLMILIAVSMIIFFKHKKWL